MLHHSALNASVFQRFGFSSFASRETTEKENAQSGNGAAAKTSGDTEVPEQQEASSSEGTVREEPIRRANIICPNSNIVE